MTDNDWIALVGAIIAFLVAIAGLVEYSTTIRTRRAEWLYRLYQEFYVDPGKKAIRELLDSTNGRAAVEKMIAEVEDELDKDEVNLLVEFCDYLSFFEFMMYLKTNKALKTADLANMFDHYLRCLAKVKGIDSYLREKGFDLLIGHLEESYEVKPT